MDEKYAALDELGSYIAGQLKRDILHREIRYGELMITVRRGAIVSAMKTLRNDANCLFQMLIDISGVDYPEREERFEVVYNLLSLKQNQRIRVKVSTTEEIPVPSIADVFPAAAWYERECWDMYGVFFSDHPDLRRMLTDYGFDGHPLRKDFPLTGYVEVRYDDEQRRVVYEPVKLRQDFRSFDFLSPWEGMTPLPGDEKATKEEPS
jgi:NADH-quinone oxidoreductase subunit C